MISVSRVILICCLSCNLRIIYISTWIWVMRGWVGGIGEWSIILGLGIMVRWLEDWWRGGFGGRGLRRLGNVVLCGRKSRLKVYIVNNILVNINLTLSTKKTIKYNKIHLNLHSDRSPLHRNIHQSKSIPNKSIENSTTITNFLILKMSKPTNNTTIATNSPPPLPITLKPEHLHIVSKNYPNSCNPSQPKTP